MSSVLLLRMTSGVKAVCLRFLDEKLRLRKAEDPWSERES